MRRMQHRQLSRSDRDHPDLLRLQHVSQRQRQPARRRLRRILDRHRAQFVLQQRLDVRGTASTTWPSSPTPSIARSSGPLFSSCRQRIVVPQRRLSEVRRVRRHPDRARRLRAERRQQHPLGETVVRLGIVRRHGPFIRPEQRDPLPVDVGVSAARRGKSARSRRPITRTTPSAGLRGAHCSNDWSAGLELVDRAHRPTPLTVRIVLSCLRATPIGRSLSTTSRRPSAPARRKTDADLQAAEGEASVGDDDVVSERQAVAVAHRRAGSDARARREGPLQRPRQDGGDRTPSRSSSPKWKSEGPDCEAREQPQDRLKTPSIVRSPTGNRRAEFTPRPKRRRAPRVEAQRSPSGSPSEIASRSVGSKSLSGNRRSSRRSSDRPRGSPKALARSKPAWKPRKDAGGERQRLSGNAEELRASGPSGSRERQAPHRQARGAEAPGETQMDPEGGIQEVDGHRSQARRQVASRRRASGSASEIQGREKSEVGPLQADHPLARGEEQESR